MPCALEGPPVARSPKVDEWIIVDWRRAVRGSEVLKKSMKCPSQHRVSGRALKQGSFECSHDSDQLGLSACAIKEP